MALMNPTYPIGVPWPQYPPQQIQPPATDPTIHPPNAAPYAGAPAPVFTPPAFLNSASNPGTYTAPAPSPYPAQNDVSGPYASINPNSAMLSARNAVNAATGASIGAAGATLTARRNTLPAEYGVLGARQGVINAQGTYNTAERGYIGTQQQANDERERDRIATLNARNNTADQAAVAEAKNFRQNMDKNYSFFGVAPPTDVVNRDGSVLPPGTRDALRTQEDIVSEHAADAEGARKAKLEAARLAVAMVGTNVSEAQRMASQAGLTLDQAQMLVEEAQLNETGASLNVRSANLNEQLAGTPPFAGAERYTDPATGEGHWLTPAEAAIRKQADERNLTPAKEKPVRENPATRYSDTPLGAFSENELTGGVQKGTWTEQQVAAELTSRGLTPEQAQIKVQQARKTETPQTPPATRYSQTMLGAFSTADLLNFIGVEGAPISPTQVLTELITRGFTPGQATIMITQEKLRHAPSTPQLEVGPDGKLKVKQ